MVSQGHKKNTCVSDDPTERVHRTPVLQLFFQFLPLTNKSYAIFRIWLHSEPFLSISVCSVTAGVIHLNKRLRERRLLQKWQPEMQMAIIMLNFKKLVHFGCYFHFCFALRSL